MEPDKLQNIEVVTRLTQIELTVNKIGLIILFNQFFFTQTESHHF